MHETGQYHARHLAVLFKTLGSTLAASNLGRPPARLVCGTGYKRKVVGRGGEEGWGRRVVKEGVGDEYRGEGVGGGGGGEGGGTLEDGWRTGYTWQYRLVG
jgi:hypothetical protein